MLRIVKVTGASLSPEYEEGDYVVVTTLPFFFDVPNLGKPESEEGSRWSRGILQKVQEFLWLGLKQGDKIIFRHPVYGTMVKRVEQVGSDGKEVYVIGSHPRSVDSRQFGPIPKEWITGKVLWHIAKPG